MKRRLQNSIAESSLTLPIAAVLATLLWWLPQGGYSNDYLHAWIVAAGLTYFVIEGANANALLRSRSQMVPSLVLLLLAACGFLHGDARAMESMLALMLALLCLMQTAPNSSSGDDVGGAHGFSGHASSRGGNRPQVWTLYAYCALSLGSIVWPPMLLLSVPFLWSQGIYLRTLTWRCFGAAVIGLSLPYYFWGASVLLMDSGRAFADHCAAIIAPVSEPLSMAVDGALPIPDTYAQLTAPDWDGVSAKLSVWVLAHLSRLSALLLVALLALTGFIHYVRKSYDDKIRVRICHYCFLTLQFTVALWLALQPQHFNVLFPLLLLTTAPSMAHFVALTHTWTTNAWCVCLATGLLAVAVINLVPDLGEHIALLKTLLVIP